MVDQNVVDRELGLEVMRRGLLTREALLPYVQRRRSDPSRSFSGLLVEGGVLTPELGDELERVARARAEATTTGAPSVPAPPSPAPRPAPPPPLPSRPLPAPPVRRSPTASMDELEFEPPPSSITRKDPGTTSATARKDPGTGSGIGRKDPGTTSAVRSKLAPHVAANVPGNTILDLDFEVPEPIAKPPESDPAIVRPTRAAHEPGDSSTSGVTPQAFQGSRTHLDGEVVPDPGRTMLEEEIDLPDAAEPAPDRASAPTV
ncbi:hypothetical protein HY251_09925, partial [bacterium]|nr:hypothetical protein [bacterium]